MKQAKAVSGVIGAHFRLYRERAGLQQDELARAARELGLNWTRATIAAIETGKRSIALEEFFMLRGSTLQKGELDGKRGLLWYASQGKPIRRRDLDEQRDAETKAARALGVEPKIVVGASYELWGRTLTDERDRVVSARMSFNGKAEGYYGKAETPKARTLQAHRGHVTRELVAQIEKLLKDPSFDAKDPYGWRRAFRTAKKRRTKK